MAPRTRAEWVLPACMLIGTFAWSFIYVSLPFHIQKMSTLDPASTLRWTGWILGISPLITVITAPISGRLGEHIDPKRGFIAVQAFQGLGFLGMALARTLPQMLFLPSILPQILPPLGVAPESTLEVGGFLIFATGIAASLGSMAAPRLADLMGDRRAVLWFLVGSSVFLAALSAAGHVWSFGVLRFLQVLCIAPVFPLSVAAIAQRASGEAIGFVNSARIGAAFLGPGVATTLLSSMPPAAVYLVLAALGLAVVPLVARMDRRSRLRMPGGGETS